MSESPACTCEYEPDDYQPDIAGPYLSVSTERRGAE